MLGRFIRGQERRRATRDTNRVVRPFEWGAEFVNGHPNGDDPRLVIERHSREVMVNSEDFFALPQVSDYVLEGERLSWTSAVETPSAENNTGRARFFPEPPPKSQNGHGTKSQKRAVVVLPQWNADAESHVTLCRVFNHLGIAALRLTLPYHEERRPVELERADYLVCANVGRTIQSVRQAVLDTRAAVSWLQSRGYERVGVVGTSVGSCTAFLAFAHDERIRAGVFNHVSGYFADVVWHGISTRHVRAGIEGSLTLEELREAWLPISPMPFAERLLAPLRPLHQRRAPVGLPRRLEDRLVPEKAPVTILDFRFRICDWKRRACVLQSEIQNLKSKIPFLTLRPFWHRSILS